MTRELPLNDVHRAAGATLGADRDWIVPVAYGDPGTALEQLRSGAVLLDASDRGLVLATGSERVDFLQGQLSNDVKALAPGGGCRATLLTRTGKLIADLGVTALEASHALDTEPDRAAPLLVALDRFLISEDAELEDVTGGVARLVVAGPEAARLVADATGVDVSALAAWGHAPLESGASVAGGLGPRVQRRDRRGVPGYELTVAPGEAAALWERLRGAGASPIGREAWELAGLEAGEARFGLDMDESTNPLEAHLDDAISYTKGCYVGQEVIAKATHLGRVGKLLSGLLIEGERVPEAGAEVLAGEEAVGRITRAARSPSLGRPVALAILKRKHAEPGERVEIRDAEGGDTLSAEVVALPFVGASS